jgi:hypothetical protein
MAPLVSIAAGEEKTWLAVKPASAANGATAPPPASIWMNGLRVLADASVDKLLVDAELVAETL